MKKHLNCFVLLLCVCASIFGSQGCSMAELIPDDDEMMAYAFVLKDETAVATLRVAPDETMFLRIDASTRAEILNPKKAGDLELPCRVAAHYSVVDRPVSSDAYSFCAVLRSFTVIDEGEIDATASSTAPITIIDDWMSSAEDRYLTVHYRILASGAVQHRFILNYDPEDPSKLTLLHDPVSDAGGTPTEGLVCFPLSFLPEGYSGQIEVSFNPLDSYQQQHDGGHQQSTLTYSTDS